MQVNFCFIFWGIDESEYPIVAHTQKNEYNTSNKILKD